MCRGEYLHMEDDLFGFSVLSPEKNIKIKLSSDGFHLCVAVYREKKKAQLSYFSFCSF